MAESIDCVVVGYNDTAFADLLGRTEPSKEVSGGYRHLMVQSLSFRGQRVKYPELLNATIEAATGAPSRFHVGRMPNLGAITLVSFMRRRGLNAELVNFYNEDKEQLRRLLADRPHAVAITTTFYFEPHPIREIVDFVREHSPETKVIVGGPHVFNICTDHAPRLQEVLFREMGADIYVFDSQGELTLSRVCQELRKAEPDLSTVPNVIHTSDGGATYVRSSREPENNDMEENVVDWTTFDPAFLAPTVQTRTARSCAYKCAFCRYPVMAGALNTTSVETVEREMKYLHAQGVTHLLFIDDTFNIPKTRFKDLCRMMIRNQFNFRWFSYFRCANADAECFDLMAESGCAGVFLGIESGDDTVLKAMNKIATADKYRDGIARLNERGIISYASFIIGHPGETEETARNTLAFIDEVKPTFYCLESFFFDPKVPIAARAAEFGLTGRAYAWKHDGMDWRQAADLVAEGYRTIKGSTVVPLYSFDLWSIAYLMGQGVPLERIKSFLAIAAEMLIQSMDDLNPYYPEQEERLVELFRPGSSAGARAEELVLA
jgi:radical SAM PhpK family P-methyltransferase